MIKLSIEEQLKNMNNNEFINAMVHLGRLFLEGYYLSGTKFTVINEDDIEFITKNK